MKTTVISGLALAALFFTARPEPAAAGTIINFAGDIANTAGTPLAAGTTFSGSFSYDTLTPARAGSDQVSAVYDALSSLSFSVVSGGTTYTFASAGKPELQIGNLGSFGTSNELTDRFALVARASDGLGGPTISGSTLQFLILRLDDSAGTIFGAANAGLPTALNLSNFDRNGVFLFFDDSVAVGNLTAFSGAVPEPTTWAMMIAGFGIVGGTMRRRRAVAALA